jgi:two-component system, OmpR family, KDP operon response regulator KdpE
MNKPKILVVEDDEDLLKGLRIRLQANGYDVVVASDGCAAVSVACQESPDLLLLDIGLPVGDGFQVIERLRSLFSVDIPIIVLSGRDPEHNVARALRSGAQAFFQKPANNEELFAAIRDVLGEATQQISG